MFKMPRRPLQDADAKRFGKLLRELRKGHSWTQAHVAKKAGIERAMVGNYELGVHFPPIPTLIELAKVLEVSVDRLLGVEEERPGDIQDRRLHQLFKETDRADITTQGLVKQVVERLLISAKSSALRTGTDG